MITLGILPDLATTSTKDLIRAVGAHHKDLVHTKHLYTLAQERGDFSDVDGAKVRTELQDRINGDQTIIEQIDAELDRRCGSESNLS